ncbi:MAG: hypothetical protein JNK30_21075 [Phenylobacterium sp.]|uniref:hypothetical protein n=1 Tax=Phenylobacterium sp. TaxID=1871053 RepID=UPI001A503B0B|nr:hypothetical protein [Phenylobacterium sp.]MBL8773893.1 hypothetical protein [Phenylobacterium sp.]
MKVVALAAVAVLIPSIAAAQYYRPATPYGQRQSPYTSQDEGPRSGTTYDYQSGNSYSWRRNSDGSTTVNGTNLQNGTMWNSRIKPNGDQSGTDSQGNFWNYNARSGSYMSSDGTVCIGKGALRTCN